MNSVQGPSGIIGIFDVAATGLMWLFVKGPATATNLLVALTDYAQVFIARTKLLGNPDQDTPEGEISRQRRVGAMAWAQVLAGVGGLGSFGVENVLKSKEDENRELSLFSKTGLSATSFLAGLTMLTTYSEKMVVAATSKGKKVGNEVKGIVLDANNDLRAFSEYLIMSFYPWVNKIKPLKKLIDFAVPFLSIRDGLCNFVNDGVSSVFFARPNTKLSKNTKALLKNSLLITNGEKHNVENIHLPAPLATKYFLGESGIRNNFIVPVFKRLGCNSIPDIAIDVDSRQLLINPQLEDIAVASNIESDKIPEVKLPRYDASKEKASAPELVLRSNEDKNKDKN